MFVLNVLLDLSLYVKGRHALFILQVFSLFYEGTVYAALNWVGNEKKVI